MCGIAGGWFLGSDAASRERLERALRTLKHRGPNDQGFESYAAFDGTVHFGHTRLSIIDLSSAGHQPMTSPTGRFSIVFNGEIYNYRELREELAREGCSFISDSDTEVLLLGWEYWGKAVIHRLVGMFAFAIFDHFEKTIVCVRDPFGIKPFFFAQANGSFVFTSEVKAAKELVVGGLELDWQQSYEYLVTGDYDSGDRTFFKGLRHLRPGHILTFSQPREEPVIERWWRPPTTERWRGSFQDAAERLREMFLRSVRLHLRSDVPLGAALSGGLDSSAVVCAIRHLEPDARINTFSFIAAGSDVSEERWVDRVVSDISATPYKIQVSGEELARDLDDMILAQGEPFGSTSIYAQYRVFKLAAESGITVTLDGQGADELLAGYHGYPGARLHSLLDGHQYGDALKFLLNWSQWPGRSVRGGIARLVNEMTSGIVNRTLKFAAGQRDFPGWLNKGVLAEAGVHSVFRASPAALSGESRGRRLMVALREAQSVGGLPALLRHADRNSMRFSIESRVPFLTTEMAEFLLSVPESFLVSPQGETKSIFRAAMRGIVPDDILDRRDKIGFATPEKDWLWGMADTVRAWLEEGCEAPFVDWRIVLRHFDAIMAGSRRFDWQTWRWINFARWHRLVLER